jgi:hypothetical protein
LAPPNTVRRAVRVCVCVRVCRPRRRPNGVWRRQTPFGEKMEKVKRRSFH